MAEKLCDVKQRGGNYATGLFNPILATDVTVTLDFVPKHIILYQIGPATQSAPNEVLVININAITPLILYTVNSEFEADVTSGWLGNVIKLNNNTFSFKAPNAHFVSQTRYIAM